METYQTFGQYQGKPKSGGLFDDETVETIQFRPEQEEAITKALRQFCTSTGRNEDRTYTPLDKFRQFLWNAKMRFGKTLCALELTRRMGVKRTLIVTHRPVVDKGWHEDFKKIFGGTDYRYATRTDDESSGDFYSLNRRVTDGKCRLVFFVSMQYLRRSTLVGGDNDEQLKQDILKTNWDLVVVDEAHEGTRTALGKRVIDQWLTKERTKLLHLSGTPFNLYEDFEDSEIYTWDYTKEQRAKREWDKKHPGEPNPYAELPRMNIYTYDLGELVSGYVEEGQTFKFSEFFRVWTGNKKTDLADLPSPDHVGRFVHENDVLAFLDLLCAKDDENNYPYSTDTFRQSFRHTLWVVPGVKEAKAMKALLEKHRIFKRFTIKNVAGDGDDDETRSNALDAVLSAIGDRPEATSTITISCGRLTTGVTVKPWTAVFYLKGSDTTSAATYMQTIFRVQSPYINSEGKMKTECYVFDFAPERTLNAIAETAKFASLTQKEKRSATTTDRQQDILNMAEFLQYCNVISLKGGKMVDYDAEELFGRLQQVYVDRVVRNGFNDTSLYDVDALLDIAGDELKELNELGAEIAKTTNMEKPKKASALDIDKLTPEQRKKLEEKRAEIRQKMREARKKGKEAEAELTPEERAELERERAEKKKKRDERDKRITILRGISLRIPLLIYGAKLDDEDTGITIDNFTSLVDPASWEEFMPRGVTKQKFNQFKKCYNPAVFTAAGKRIRALARETDSMHIDDRIKRIAWIFSTFHNPDKETVLTPWRVVNMHMSDTLGGYCFFNEKFDGDNQRAVLDEDGNVVEFIDTTEPRFVDHGDVTESVFHKIAEGDGIASRVLEINSKTGLYPLYVTYTMYCRLLKYYDEVGLLDNPIDNLSVGEEQAAWDDVVGKNIYVICNTPMAASITRRTLMGFREPDKKLNIKADKLIKRATTDREALVKAIKTIGYWNGTTSKTMINFDAVVGNPPYQIKAEGDSGRRNSFYALPIYQDFIDIAIMIAPDYISMITPSRWMTKSGQGIKEEWVDKMINSNHFISIFDYLDSTECFSGVSIGSGINYFLYSQNFLGPCNYMLHFKGAITKNYQKLNEIGAGIIIRDPYASRIFQKVKKVEGNYTEDCNFSTLISPRDPYTSKINGVSVLGTNWTGFSTIRDDDHPIKLYLNKRVSPTGIAWIKKTDIRKNAKTLSFHKVYIPKAYGSATDPYVIGKPIYGEPNSVCSVTYLVVGFNNEISDRQMAENIISYMSSKFFRYLVSMRKKTQDNPRDVFQFVPLQDFTQASDIDWTQTISNIDRQLYLKYGLDMFEQEFIESHIQSME
jgi:hypothetical protein